MSDLSIRRAHEEAARDILATLSTELRSIELRAQEIASKVEAEERLAEVRSRLLGS